jgi:hypothetical protein
VREVAVLEVAWEMLLPGRGYDGVNGIVHGNNAVKYLVRISYWDSEQVILGNNPGHLMLWRKWADRDWVVFHDVVNWGVGLGQDEIAQGDDSLQPLHLIYHVDIIHPLVFLCLE